MEEYSRQIEPELETRLRRYLDKREECSLSEFASLSKYGTRRRQDRKEDLRAPYSRDADRILHTHAYSRYIDKTQVFFLVDNDHITHRVLHVQMVSKIARTIGRALMLNEDLIEAIAIGHDIGHLPFGHRGEKFLTEQCKEHKIGRFAHNIQSVQSLDQIEDVNLTLQVLDGILCHDGEVHEQELRPNRSKDWKAFDGEIVAMKDNEKRFSPMTLEGCVVRFADPIAYVGRDIQDARELGLMNDLNSLPSVCRECLGTSNADMINTLAVDVVENSYDCDALCFSPEVSEAFGELRDFNSRMIYENAKVVSQEEKMGRMFRVLFDTYLQDLENRNRESAIFKDFCNAPWINKEYIREAMNPEIVRDYIAGMTDRYFMQRFEEIVMPHRVHDFKD